MQNVSISKGFCTWHAYLISSSTLAFDKIIDGPNLPKTLSITVKVFILISSHIKYFQKYIEYIFISFNKVV